MHRLLTLVTALLLAAAACTGASDRGAPHGDFEGPANAEEAMQAVTLDGIHEHLEALAEIAADNGGTRAAGTTGYEESAAYVGERLVDAGYDVTVQEFTMPTFELLGPSTLEVDGLKPLMDGRDFKAMLYSGAGDVTGPLSIESFDPDAVDRDGEGCDGLPDFRAGSVALLRPGPCYFRDLVTSASAAGAAAVIISFPEYRKGHVLRPTLITPEGIDIPVLSATDKVGRDLYAAGEGAEVRLEADVASDEEKVSNVIAESKAGSDDDVLMVGGHLDSVVDGPGINDNGSGVATILEVAEELADAPLERRLRFAFWAGEELGLLGSTHYVEALSDGQKSDIAAYLNFDMLASSNHIHYVYADQGPEGSESISQAFEEHLEDAGAPFESIDLEGRSDHGPFLQAGIPVGGLFSGAEELLTEEQAEDYGGEAGRPADPCYHLACDGLENIDDGSLQTMAAAIADVVFELASSSEAI